MGISKFRVICAYDGKKTRLLAGGVRSLSMNCRTRLKSITQTVGAFRPCLPNPNPLQTHQQRYNTSKLLPQRIRQWRTQWEHLSDVLRRRRTSETSLVSQTSKTKRRPVAAAMEAQLPRQSSTIGHGWREPGCSWGGICVSRDERWSMMRRSTFKPLWQHITSTTSSTPSTPHYHRR